MGSSSARDGRFFDLGLADDVRCDLASGSSFGGWIGGDATVAMTGEDFRGCSDESPVGKTPVIRAGNTFPRLLISDPGEGCASHGCVGDGVGSAAA